MGRGRRGRGAWGLAVAIGAVWAASATGAARFPDALYTYVEPSDVIRKIHFSPVAEEVAAIERTLGVGLGNIARVHAPCYRLEDPISGELHDTIWTAPYRGRITSVTCDATGVQSATLFDLQVDDGTPVPMALPGSCQPDVAAFTPPAGGGVMAAGDRLDLIVGVVIGDAQRISVCWVFQPES